ncbi:hypothetical protein AKJ09_00891 [Labilithrix luteola]|uniref:Uncharacterized protein n=1 Tax=Labilithrix luteola TaxID=1391654 RepID=A0A0K1PL40_9BACT|nr:hypothetical protein AKJ09_00891 [Labilithrix luteola]
MLNSIDPPRNFTIDTSERIRALSIGVPAYAARKRQIEDAEESLLEMFLELHGSLVAEGVTLEELVRTLEEQAAACSFTKLNDLIARHNRYYPIEANLGMDRKTGAYLLYGKEWRRSESWTAARIVAVTLETARARAAENADA